VCHTEAAAATQSKVPHEPAAGECTTCHLPHAGTARLLREKTPALCETCHAGVGEEIARRMPHPPAAEGECMTCHDPHGTDNKGILIDNPRMLCGSCHDTETELSLRVTHAPATSGDCSACHEPHGSQADHMLVADLGKACLSCHKREEALAAQHPHAPFESGDCISCHRPHGSAKEALLAMDPAVLCASCHDEGTGGSSLLVRHLPVRRGQCLACHDPHGGQTDTLLRRRDDRTLCLSCHVDQGDTLSRSDYHVHPPFKEGSCLECHNAHESPRDALLAKAPGELCSGCHDAADPAMTAPHRGLIDSGTDCTACHDGHATADENLLLADQHEPFIDRNCAACHRGAAP
jgi:predicted CXXCH cytochrome family protein